jgi:two-component system response regulator FixJ
MTASPTVFVVDDDSSVRRSLGRLLASASYRVVECASAEEFLALSDWARPSCVLTDVRMPGMTGIDLLEAIRARGGDIPIILSSGDVDAATAAQARAGGVTRFLSKPFAATELLAALAEAIERDRLAIAGRRA